MVFRLTSVLSFRSVLVVRHPISIVQFFPVIFSVGMFVPSVSEEILPCIVSPREIVSVVLYFPVVFTVLLHLLFLRSV